jgi:hypothetical protein
VQAPKIQAPAAGEVLAGESMTDVTWDAPAGVASISLLFSSDDGVTWTVEADHIVNTGSYAWIVPNTSTAQARLGIMVIYDTDETGVVPESEFAESDRFSISSPTDVGDVPVAIALSVVNPSIGQVMVSVALPTEAPAHLELLDVIGRRLVSRQVSSLGVGQHTINLGEGRRLSAGLYLVRLTQGPNRRTERVAVMQ